MYQAFFASILGLPSMWRVTHARHLDGDNRIELEIVSAPGAPLTCPVCGNTAPMVSEKIDRWFHDNFFHLRARLSVHIPLVSCETCGINPVPAPWEPQGKNAPLGMIREELSQRFSLLDENI